MKKSSNEYLHKSGKNYWYFFVKGWLSILDGLVSILTFGRIWSSFEYIYKKRHF